MALGRSSKTFNLPSGIKKFSRSFKTRYFLGIKYKGECNDFSLDLVSKNGVKCFRGKTQVW